MMMTQDRATHPLATPSSPRNLNPSAPAFRQGQTAPTSPKNLNPSAPVFRHSPVAEKSPTDGIYHGVDTGVPGNLTNGDLHANSSNYVVPSGAGVQLGASPLPQGPHQVQNQGPDGITPAGLALAPSPLLESLSSQQPVLVTMSPHQHQLLPSFVSTAPVSMNSQQQVRASSQSSPVGMMESGDSPPNGVVNVEEEAAKISGAAEELEGAVGGQGMQEYKYPDDELAPIRKQMQFYFSNENLPNDKFLNQHMDSDKFIPLELFLDFGRIKPICNNLAQLMQAVESSSILELSEDRKKVRVSQCRKTLTLRGFPASATEEDVRQFILEMGAYVPTHIEFVMFKEKYSVWYVSFKDETAALNSFFQFHNQKAVYKDHNIGCCIKSSGTLAAAGYFPSSEESNQRRLAQQTQAAAATAPVHAVQSAMPQPQQPQALMQPFSTMQIHSYMSGSPTGIYYQQTQGPFMPYMTGMIQGWPGPAAAMEPGLIMQNNGLQPQHIRTSLPRPHLLPSGSGGQHRYNRPQRGRQNNLERHLSERSIDRAPIVSVSGASRSSSRSIDGSTTATVGPQGAYQQRRTAAREEVATQVMPHAVPHQYTPLVAQQQQHNITTAAAPTAGVSSTAIEPVAVPHFQPIPQQQPVIPGTTSVPLTSTPPPGPLQMHHHSQPPPTMQSQQSTQHCQPQQPQSHHSVIPPHSSQHHQLQQQSQTHHHHQQTLQSSHPHQHNISTGHHHHPQHQHHSASPQQAHQQPQLGNRPERRGRRKREDIRNQRSDRNQSNRVNFSSQAPTVADNFTMEANSFPPLPGALNSVASSEILHENRMSDVVRGISRNSAPRAPSSIPSPVTTPAPATLGASSSHQNRALASAHVTVRGVDDGDSALDDDATSSSQEEVDADVNALEPRSGLSESHSASPVVEPALAQPRSQKASTPVANLPVAATQKPAESHPSSAQPQAAARGPQQAAHQHQVVPAVINVSTSSFEAPKLSYAQILALKNREAANNSGAGETTSTGGLPPNPNSGTPNGLNSAHNATSSVAGRGPGQSLSAFREQGNSQVSPSPRGPSKDSSRSEGLPSSTRPPNGSRRNSKENRTSNKFDRRKMDTHQK